MNTSRRIIIDNATLSGVERIIGASQTRNLGYVDNDIICLEKLLTAILFSDELIGVDDYKDEYRSSRLKDFDFIRFATVEPAKYYELAAEAADFAKGIAFSFEGSRLVGDAVSFFEALRIDPQMRWNVFVSSEYLTLSLLVDGSGSADYERSIDSILRHENVDRGHVAAGSDHLPAVKVVGRPDIQAIKDLVHAISSGNPQFAGIDGKSLLDRMVFGYGWAAERSYFYNAVARMEGADVYLAPLRDAFCESCFRIDYPSQAVELIEALKRKSQEALVSILTPSGQARFAIRLPFFTTALISKTSNPRECIEQALSMRSASEFRGCRAIFQHLDHLSSSDKVKEINGALRHLEQSCENLMRKYAVSVGGGLHFSLSLGLTGISLGADLKLSQLFRHHKHGPFVRVFRNIAQEMLNVERLGGLYEKVCSSLRRHPDAGYPKFSSTPKHMEHKENEYGRPVKL